MDRLAAPYQQIRSLAVRAGAGMICLAATAMCIAEANAQSFYAHEEGYGVRQVSAEAWLAQQPQPGRAQPAPRTPRAPAAGAPAAPQPAAPQPAPPPPPQPTAPAFDFASSPQSAAPNMIGDMFSSGPPIQIGVPMVTGRPQTIALEFAPTGGLPGQNTPTSAMMGMPVVFTVLPSTINGVPTPGTTFMSLDNTENLGSVFPITPGSPEFQQAIAAGNQNVYGPGTTTFDSGQAELTLDDGSTGVTVGDQFAIRQITTFTPILVEGEVFVAVPNPSGGGSVGRVKIAENNSPLPRNRVFVNYSYFNNVNMFEGGVNVNRYTPGFESTFYDDQMSFELRAPFATTLDSNITAGGLTDTSNLEFGNLSMVIKAILYGDDIWTFTGGLGIAAPTANDLKVRSTRGTPILEVDNESVHLQPYVAALWTPNDRFFFQSFFTLDIDANGNPVSANLDGAGLRPIGRLNDPAILYADIGFGYWLYRDPSGYRGITGIAPVFEVHYNASLDDYDVVSQQNFFVGDPSTNFDVINLTVGAHMMLGRQSSLTLGYSTPVGEGVDKQFDGEARVLFNYFFDPPTRQSAVNF